MTTNYTVSPENRKLYGALVILNMMVQDRWELGVALDDDDQFLEPLTQFLMRKDYIKVQGHHFVPTKKGRDIIAKFQEKYITYLRGYDHYGKVDLQSGAFGIEQIHEYDLDSDAGWDAWQAYLNQTDDEGHLRFTNLCIAIAELKKMDPIEIVFMSYLNEDTFLIDAGDIDENGWQFHLAMGSRFDDIEDVVNTAWKAEDLDQTASGGATGTQVLENVITRGAEVRKAVVEAELAAQRECEAAERAAAQEAAAQQTVMTETVTVVEEVVVDDYGGYPAVVIDPWDVGYYDYYYDPYYVDPCFAVVVYDDDWYW